MPHHVIAVAESDSFLKWAVSLFGQLPAGTKTEVVVACSPARPSASQRVAALSGTAYAGHDPEVLSPGQLQKRVERDRPDAVLLALTGPSVHAYSEALSRVSHRPVVMTGIPGIAIPARRRAWGYRGAVDLWIVHSHREAQEYDQVRQQMGMRGRLGLATIPFLAGPTEILPDRELATGGNAGEQQAFDHAPSGELAAETSVEPLNAVATPKRNRVLFATQGKVPRVKKDRILILQSLARLAANRPDLEVVVKTRGAIGEFHTHHEPHHFQALWDELVEAGEVHAPDALTFAAGSMAEQLANAVALVTVSSTAVLEAMALDIPVLLIDEFGVSENLINQVFVGSGVMGGLDELERGDFRHPETWWLADNYFHPRSDNDWIGILDELVGQARSGRLESIASGLNKSRSAKRRRLDRLRLTPAGSAIVRARVRMRQRVKQSSLPSASTATRSS
ncbi:DUF6716 putative glycosyltransferase [Kineosporia babensis]|uniref:Uncharacterized protein n=1 Tax=Kineosporia babensis TaxID=499548 RepID=A0A9X1SSC3_9ACTN|nr:DUF6716 putative glycosyltransferase [Kineosporia babensis]MCD5309460.1 hypothetical protein [Kineosporia babensis]